MSGPPDFTTWRTFGISSRRIDPETPNLHPCRIEEVDNQPRPWLAIGGRIGQFYRIPENSRAAIPTRLVEICDFWLIRIVGLSVLECTTSLPPNVTTSGETANGDHVWANLTNVAEWRWRISVASPDFGALGMLGIYAACVPIFEIADSSRPGIIQKIDTFC